MNKQILHFTLGPVQSFVAQARRTRDLWSGSFLLSYLAGQAMYAVIKESQGQSSGRILFPAVQDSQRNLKDGLLKAIAASAEGLPVAAGSSVGTLPNRFKAELPENFQPTECVAAVQNAWERIAGAVWDRYLADAAKVYGCNTEAIWQRQVQNFWDMAWVVTEDVQQDDLLDRRKNWRSYVLTVEPGDKCSMMGNLQELSGYTRSQKRQDQDRFWQDVRKNVKESNLRSDERLCAVSLIKRMFPEVFPDVLGWPVSLGFPSTTYLAAVPWIEKNIANNPGKAADFASLARKAGLGITSSPESEISSIKKAAENHPEIRDFVRLDGNLFFAETLTNDGPWSEHTATGRKQLAKLLPGMIGQPISYYAVLLMDGDSMGALLQQYNSITVSQALAGFSGKVPAVVSQHNGVLVYAGGDDVLALLPLRDALPAAVELRNCYVEAFKDTGIPSYRSTISAAIIYAHHHVPLKSVLHQAHSLLDDVAKEKAGRDSLAINVWKSPGVDICWAIPWEKLFSGGGNLLAEMVEAFSGSGVEQKQFNSSFFYHLRKYFEFFSDMDLNTGLDPIELLAAEYLRNRERQKVKLSVSEIEERMEKLLQICRVCTRTVTGENVAYQDQGYTIDGALLVRFLSGKEVLE